MGARLGSALRRLCMFFAVLLRVALARRVVAVARRRVVAAVVRRREVVTARDLFAGIQNRRENNFMRFR